MCACMNYTDDNRFMEATSTKNDVSASGGADVMEGDEVVGQQVEANRRLWDERVGPHVGSDFYDVDAFRAGRNSLDLVELEGVGEVSGQSLLHLQCHFGLDTLSWARCGARVVGVDFSLKAVEQARELAVELALDARFVCCEVGRALEHLGGETFDVVFTSYGAISWLPDLAAWARVIAGALKSGGRFFVADSHPTLWMFDDAPNVDAVCYRYSYFDREALRTEERGSYACPEAEIGGPSYSWQHTFEEIVSALLDAGLQITSLREYPYLSFQWFPFMVRGADGYWRMPAGSPDLPLMFSITAEKGAC